jgi:hypothetical protein
MWLILLIYLEELNLLPYIVLHVNSWNPEVIYWGDSKTPTLTSRHCVLSYKTVIIFAPKVYMWFFTSTLKLLKCGFLQFAMETMCVLMQGTSEPGVLRTYWGGSSRNPNLTWLPRHLLSVARNGLTNNDLIEYKTITIFALSELLKDKCQRKLYNLYPSRLVTYSSSLLTLTLESSGEILINAAGELRI